MRCLTLKINLYEFLTVSWRHIIASSNWKNGSNVYYFNDNPVAEATKEEAKVPTAHSAENQTQKNAPNQSHHSVVIPVQNNVWTTLPTELRHARGAGITTATNTAVAAHRGGDSRVSNSWPFYTPGGRQEGEGGIPNTRPGIRTAH